MVLSNAKGAAVNAVSLDTILHVSVGIPFTSGNAIEAFRNGDTIFPAMLKAIDESRTFVDFETFVYWSGDIADRVADALVAAAKRGVRIRVLLDAVGSLAMPPHLVEALEGAGVELQRFRPIRPWSILTVDQRTHRKILVCDGEVAFTGGVGIAREWEGNARSPEEWRETHFRIRGPAVAGIWAGFVEDWVEACPTHVPLADHPLEGLAASVHSRVGDAEVQVIRSTAARAWSDLATVLRAVVHHAQNRIRITTAYFVPDATFIDELGDAAARGVDVDIIVPGPYADHRIVKVAEEAIVGTLLERGVRMWAYQPTMMHAKVLTVDGTIALIGSANMNHRSLRKDQEITLAVKAPDLVAELDGHFDEDLRKCQEASLSQWRKRSLGERTLGLAATLFKKEM